VTEEPDLGFGGQRGLLGDPTLWVEPPRGLRTRCLASTSAGQLWRRQWRPVRSGTGTGVDPGAEVGLAGTGVAPEARGLARLRRSHGGLSLWLSVERLPPDCDGASLEAWLVAADGSRLRAGTFAIRAASATVALGVPTNPGSGDAHVEIRRHEPFDGRRSSDEVLLRGHLW
jgi:hypothetical protein